jgi:hypothetical protein
MSTSCVISRQLWLRPKRGMREPTMMLNDAGQGCVVGHFALACGVPAKALVNAVGLFHVKNPPPEMAWLVPEPGKASRDLYRVIDMNDDPNMSERQRERTLRAEFASHDVALSFVP